MIKLLNIMDCGNLFLDIGGYKGEYSKMILKNTNCNVLLYEPQAISSIFLFSSFFI